MGRCEYRPLFLCLLEFKVSVPSLVKDLLFEPVLGHSNKIWLSDFLIIMRACGYAEVEDEEFKHHFMSQNLFFL